MKVNKLRQLNTQDRLQSEITQIKSRLQNIEDELIIHAKRMDWLLNKIEWEQEGKVT